MDGVHHGPRRRFRWSTAALGLLVGLLVLLSGLVVRSYLVPSADDAPVPDAANPRGGPLPTSGGGSVENPEFPWPPPRASALTAVPAALLAKAGASPRSLGDVERRLTAALDANEYSERSYYLVPDGFAIATRLEQINPDGTSKAGHQRWAAESGPLREFSLQAYLSALFSASQGYYRVIVFVVTSHPFSQADVAVTREDALAWVSKGLNTLPRAVADKPYSPEHSCSALIYEFEQPSKSKRHEAKMQIPGRLTAAVHLRKANLWKELER
jgi:hypothetical protein